MGQDLQPEGHQLVIGGGHKDDNVRAILIVRGQHAVVEALNSDHEEADTRLLLHAKHASPDHRRIVMQSRQTSVCGNPFHIRTAWRGRLLFFTWIPCSYWV